MNINPNCPKCGKPARVFEYRPYCSEECKPKTPKKSTTPQAQDKL